MTIMGSDDRPTGPWQSRVRFGPGGTFAYRPGEVLVAADAADRAEERLSRWSEERSAERDQPIDLRRERGLIASDFVRFTGDFALREVIDELRSEGVTGQPNHVLFATSCCPPHPSDPSADQFYANPYYANPYYANPYYANPYYANASGCGHCRCGCGPTANPYYANPYYANPYYANPYYANPYYANAPRSPFMDQECRHAGARTSSARPADPPTVTSSQASVSGVRVAILDTGWAQSYVPTGLGGISIASHGGDHPDADGDGFLDPAAGHGTFIAGIIEQLAPGCDIGAIEVLSTFGDGDEAEIATTLQRLADRPEPDRPHIVNLSFGGYTPLGMAALASAVEALHAAGSVVVASAGNDATCTPMFPATLPKVVGVGALDDQGKPAPFTNYGPWVSACAPGVDRVSIFFEGFNGAGPPESGYDPDHFQGWARWSGTSFAAPVVVAALARAVAGGDTPQQAVKRVVADEKLPRRPMLGTVVT
jgi:hypothetical protein